MENKDNKQLVSDFEEKVRKDLIESPEHICQMARENFSSIPLSH